MYKLRVQGWWGETVLLIRRFFIRFLCGICLYIFTVNSFKGTGVRYRCVPAEKTLYVCVSGTAVSIEMTTLTLVPTCYFDVCIFCQVPTETG